MLALETMHFADEIRGEEDVDNAPVDVEPSSRELRMAEQLIESLTVAWDPTRYRDTYRDRVMQLIERKAKGEEIVVQGEEEAPQVADLMDALRASVEGRSKMTKDELLEALGERAAS